MEFPAVQVIVSSLSCLECFEFDGQSRPTRPQQKPSPRTATSSKPRKLERIIFLESVAVDNIIPSRFPETENVEKKKPYAFVGT
ncbi:hypothetical protein V6N13_133629 [Hibiscus sabdariffa]